MPRSFILQQETEIRIRWLTAQMHRFISDPWRGMNSARQGEGFARVREGNPRFQKMGWNLGFLSGAMSQPGRRASIASICGPGVRPQTQFPLQRVWTGAEGKTGQN
jgi:hypothetical protein